jgi:hypothetical protein
MTKTSRALMFSLPPGELEDAITRHAKWLYPEARGRKLQVKIQKSRGQWYAVVIAERTINQKRGLCAP